jgi:hypothetical protein
MIDVEVLQTCTIKTNKRTNPNRQIKIRNHRDSGDQIEDQDTTFDAIVENCASISIQSCVRGFLVRNSRRFIAKADEISEMNDESTEKSSYTRCKNDISETKQVRCEFLEAWLSYCYSMGVRLSAVEVIGMLKAMDLLTTREHDDVIFAWNVQEPEKVHYGSEPKFRLRIHSNEELFKSDLFHAWSVIEERVRRHLGPIKLASEPDRSMFLVIQQKSRIPIEALQLLRKDYHEQVFEIQPKDIQFFLRCIGVKWNMMGNFSLLEILQDLDQTKCMDFSLKLRLRIMLNFLKVLTQWNVLNPHYCSIDEALYRSLWKIVELQEDLETITKTLESTRIVLTAAKTKARSSESKPIAESKPVNGSHTFDAKSTKTTLVSRKDMTKIQPVHSGSKGVRSSNDERSSVDYRDIPKVSTVDIVFRSDFENERNKSSMNASTVKVQNKRLQRNAPISKKPLSSLTRTSQNKRVVANTARKKISSDKKMAPVIADQPKDGDIYETANEKLNLILEKINSRLKET